MLCLNFLQNFFSSNKRASIKSMIAVHVSVILENTKPTELK